MPVVKVTEAISEPVTSFIVKHNKRLIRVLHVDDESSLLKIAKQCLEMEDNFQVDTASSVEEAQKKMKEEQEKSYPFLWTSREGRKKSTR